MLSPRYTSFVALLDVLRLLLLFDLNWFLESEPDSCLVAPLVCFLLVCCVTVFVCVSLLVCVTLTLLAW